MKRQNNLFEKITDYNNIRLAFLKAIRGNRSSLSAVKYCKNTEKNLALLRNKLLTLRPQWGGYKSFQITDPKLRTISTAPFEQRIMHHAVMNILEPVIERQLIFHSYACRKGKGTQTAVLFAFNQCKKNSFFLKLDIRKYFDSIDHEILKFQLRRIIRDKKVIFLLDGIIDSYETAQGKGVPIGNLTSQFFANMYLSCMDHYILEKLHPSAYCRYMDDFVIWTNSKEKIKDIFLKINEYVNNNLGLTIKPPVFGNSSSGLPFLGFLVKDKGVYLMQKSKRRVKERVKEISALLFQNKTTEEKAAERVRSVFAAIALARTNRFRKLIFERGERLRTKSLMGATV
jgi:hypothetical protein